MGRMETKGKQGGLLVVPCTQVPSPLTGQQVAHERSLLLAAQRLHNMLLVPNAEGNLR